MDTDLVSWKRIESLTDLLVKKIRLTKKEFNSISTISRGGLVPARLIADRLNINKILVDKGKIPPDSLFVDDIFDSGDTFKKILLISDSPQNLVYATLFARRGKKYPKQLIYATKTTGSEYIVYPWDKFEHKGLKFL